MLVLARLGHTVPHIADMVLRSADTVARVLKRYVSGGLDAVPRRTSTGRGRTITSAWEEVRRFGERIGTSRRYRIPYLRALAVLAQFRGEMDTAMAQVQEAAQLAEEMGLPGELWSLWGALGEMYQKQGEERQAHQTFARAAEIIHSLANRMEDEQQRTTFLSAQSVQRVFERVRLS